MNCDVIRLLPDSVANQIAAGEVIQRPASVIKELVENSVDAGANEITIVIKDAGRTLIQVIDNGCGMSPTDARMAFERHATSKIANADDLMALHTMGFRGEALASIAAVAQIELRTMRREDTVGTKLQVAESTFESQEPCACAPGSNMMVKNLFRYIPARRRFLKKDSVELSHILREFEKLALVNTNVDFTLIHNDVTLHQVMKGSFKQRIGALFGKSLEAQLAPLATETSLVKISGFVGMPRYAKRRGAQQFFFVNGRHMRHPMFNRAVLRCYEQLIPADTQPAYFINFDVEPSSIDVNIHPQKHEIKFVNEEAIVQILTAAIKETLGKTQASGALDFDIEDSPDIPLFNPDNKADVPDDFSSADYNPFANPGGGELRPAATESTGGLRAASWIRSNPRTVRSDWEKLYADFDRQREETFENLRTAPNDGFLDNLRPATEAPEASSSQTAPGCLNAPQGYIVANSREGMMVIDQNRAHVRILYDRILEQMKGHSLDSQKLIFAEDIELPAEQAVLVEGLGEHLQELGFEIKHTSGPNWTIEAAPAILRNIAPGEALQEILADLVPEAITAGEFQAPAALAMARSSAISSRDSLSVSEMESIVAELFSSSAPAHTPDGLPIYTLITADEIARRLS